MWADLYVQNSLALRIMGEYGIPAYPELLAAFDRSERTIEKNVIDLPNVRYPNILPTGQSRNGYHTGSAFFIEDERLQDNKGESIQSDTGDYFYNE
jgi:hypothetical protein